MKTLVARPGRAAGNCYGAPGRLLRPGRGGDRRRCERRAGRRAPAPRGGRDRLPAADRADRPARPSRAGPGVFHHLPRAPAERHRRPDERGGRRRRPPEPLGGRGRPARPRLPAPGGLRPLPPRHAGRRGTAGGAAVPGHPADRRGTGHPAESGRPPAPGGAGRRLPRRGHRDPGHRQPAARVPGGGAGLAPLHREPVGAGRPGRGQRRQPGRRPGHRPDHGGRGPGGDPWPPGRDGARGLPARAAAADAQRPAGGRRPAVAARPGRLPRAGPAGRPAVAGAGRDGQPAAALGRGRRCAPAPGPRALAAAARRGQAAVPAARGPVLGGAPAPDAAGHRPPGHRAALRRPAVSAGGPGHPA